jgi:2-oxoglutarate ferredoxin oxidoreductase subunit gamma
MTEEQATMRILIAGFGGQGVLFLGKLIAYAGMSPEREVTWLPSYGPEMRGGTANCAVILSKEAIGSPIVAQPDVLIAMNLPSFQAYQQQVASGGVIVMDATLIGEAPLRTDIVYYALPATKMASEHGLEGLANMILFGKFLQECLSLESEKVLSAVQQVIPEHKKHLLDANMSAITLGRAFSEADEDTSINQKKTDMQPRRAG